MNITVEEGALKYTKHEFIKKYSNDDKKDLLSETKFDTEVIFKDDDGNIYEDGKIIISDEFVTEYIYKYSTDQNDNVILCAVEKSVKKNGKLLDIEKTGEKKYYDSNGRLIKVEYTTRDGVIYDTVKYEYDIDNHIIAQRSKNTHTKIDKLFYKDEVSSITETTLKSKMSHTKYKAYFDSNNRVYKVIDGCKRVEIDYERDFDCDGNILSETKRFFDISSPKAKKLISYIVTSYVPAADYKIGRVIKNGILTEEHTYDLKGEELSLFKLEVESGREVYTRSERLTDADTGDVSVITTTKITDSKTGKVIKTKTTKHVYDKDNNLLSYSEDDSTVSTYEYDEEGRRSSVITKKLVNEEFKVINEIKYTYTTDEETGETSKIRELTIYDEDGEVITKNVHTEIVNNTTEDYSEEITIFEPGSYNPSTDDSSDTDSGDDNTETPSTGDDSSSSSGTDGNDTETGDNTSSSDTDSDASDTTTTPSTGDDSSSNTDDSSDTTTPSEETDTSSSGTSETTTSSDTNNSETTIQDTTEQTTTEE